jgi:hypothetical protein
MFRGAVTAGPELGVGSGAGPLGASPPQAIARRAPAAAAAMSAAC